MHLYLFYLYRLTGGGCCYAFVLHSSSLSAILICVNVSLGLPFTLLPLSRLALSLSFSSAEGWKLTTG